MTKHRSQDALAAARASLAAEGIGEAELAAGALDPARLAAVLERGGDVAEALAQLLGNVPRREHCDLLQKVEATTHGSLRREVRRALYRLRGAGLEPTAPAEPPARPAAAPLAPEPEGWLSHVDGRGDQLVWITKPCPGGLLFVSARINDESGLSDLSASEVSKRQFRNQRDDLRDRHGLRMVPVDWHYADALVAAAQELGAPRSGQSYSAVRVQLTTEPPARPESPIYTAIPKETIDAELVDASREVLESSELKSWFPPPDRLEPFLKEIFEARSSPLVLSQHQQTDRLEAIVQRATDDLYPAERFVGRLEKMAFFFLRSGRERYARICLAVAAALASQRLAPHSVPLLSDLVRQPLSMIYESARAQEEEAKKGSVLVTPGSPVSGRR